MKPFDIKFDHFNFLNRDNRQPSLFSAFFLMSFFLLSLTQRLKNKQNKFLFQNDSSCEFGVRHIFFLRFTFSPVSFNSVNLP
jgi:hypothetical protein